MSGWGVLRGSVGGQWRLVAGAGLLGVTHQVGEALVPVLIGVVIDEAVSTGRPDALLRWIVALAVVFAVLSISFRFSLRLGETAAQRAAHALRIGVATRVLDDRGGAGIGRLSGELASVATSDAQRVGTVNLALPTFVAGIAGLVAGAVALLVISIPLGILVLIAAPLMLYLAHLLGKPLERRSDAEQDRAAQAAGIAADLVAGLRALKGIGAERAAARRYRVTSQESLGAAVRAARAQSWLDGSMLGLTGVFLAVVALVGGQLAVRGDITVGQFVTAVGLAQFLLWPLDVFAWVNGLFAQGRASAARIAEVMGAEPAVASGDAGLPAAVPGALRIRELSSATLRSVDMTVTAGEVVGVVAESADAVALVRCLAREVDPGSGGVELDGVCLSTMDIGAVRQAVLVAAHDADLFEGTLLDNVRAGSDGDLDGAMAAAAAHEVAAALPHGVDTVLTERGRSLSGGQRQRVALARALAADAPVLVVHDPTTAIDAVTEVAVADGLRRLRSGRTTIVVTTSPALLAVTDRVVVLADGAVVAEGSHLDLVRDHDTYRRTVLA